MQKIINYTRKFSFPATKHRFDAHTSQNKPEIVHIKCKARETEIQRENRKLTPIQNSSKMNNPLFLES